MNFKKFCRLIFIVEVTKKEKGKKKKKKKGT